MKKIELLFYKTNPSEKNIGMKHVLCEITTPDNKIVYDWGFAEWNGFEWGEIRVPEDFTAKVIWWANTVDPVILLKKESKIISIKH